MSYKCKKHERSTRKYGSRELKRREVNERDVGFEIKYSYSFILLGCVYLLTMKYIV